jgi:hypothetical protein
MSKNLICVTIFVVSSVVLPVTLTSAQTRTAANSAAATGSVKGRVFLITKDGDLKPARSPVVYLLYHGQAHYDPNAVDHFYQLASLDAYGKRLELNLFEDKDCQMALLDSSKILLDMEEWALDNKKPMQVLKTKGDIEGHFKITGVPRGNYRIVALGQAGANDAHWDKLDVVVKAGAPTLIDLERAAHACLIE